MEGNDHRHRRSFRRPVQFSRKLAAIHHIIHAALPPEGRGGTRNPVRYFRNSVREAIFLLLLVLSITDDPSVISLRFPTGKSRSVSALMLWFFSFSASFYLPASVGSAAFLQKRAVTAPAGDFIVSSKQLKMAPDARNLTFCPLAAGKPGHVRFFLPVRCLLTPGGCIYSCNRCKIDPGKRKKRATDMKKVIPNLQPFWRAYLLPHGHQNRYYWQIGSGQLERRQQMDKTSGRQLPPIGTARQHPSPMMMCSLTRFCKLYCCYHG